MHNTRAFEEMKFILDALLMTGLYLGGVFVLNTQIEYIFTIMGASLAGAIVLAYFRRDRDHKEIFFKTACAAICGLVSGSVIARYYQVESMEYVAAIYFIASLLALFFIKGLLSVTEQNASGLIVTVIQRILNTQGSNLRISPHETADTVIKTDVVVKKSGEIIQNKKKEN